MAQKEKEDLYHFAYYIEGTKFAGTQAAGEIVADYAVLDEARKRVVGTFPRVDAKVIGNEKDLMKDAWYLKRGVVVYVHEIDNLLIHPLQMKWDVLGLRMSGESLDSMIEVASELNLPLPSLIKHLTH